MIHFDIFNVLKDYKYVVWSFFMPEFICPDCGKKLFHENETTLTVEKQVHLKFCPAKKKH